MSRILIITGQFVPYTKSLGGILRVYSYLNSLKKKHQLYLLVSKTFKNKNYGYLGLDKKKLKGINIFYLNNDTLKLTTSFFNFGFLRNIFYLFGLDYAFKNNEKYRNKSLELIKKYKINYVIISSPPFSLFYLVEKIKDRFKNIKIILDYRDGWTTRIQNILNYPIKIFIQNFIEKKILSYSDYVLTATSRINQSVKILQKRKTKTLLIRNGFLYKPEQKKKIEENQNKIKIGYFGLISEDDHSYRNIKIVYNALKDSKFLQNKFMFEFYGNNEINNINIKNFKPFKFKNNLNYKNALFKMTQMDYLLIIHTERSTSKEMVTSKFYDYLAARTPIINVSSGENEVGNIIKKFKLGKNIDYEKENLNKYFLNLKKNNKKIKWKKNFNFFSRGYQNKKLIRIIK